MGGMRLAGLATCPHIHTAQAHILQPCSLLVQHTTHSNPRQLKWMLELKQLLHGELKLLALVTLQLQHWPPGLKLQHLAEILHCLKK